MDDETPIIRKYSSSDEMKADEYRYWQSRPAHERLDAVEEMIETAYALKGWQLPPDLPRSQMPVVRFPCPRLKHGGNDPASKKLPFVPFLFPKART